MLSRRYQGSVKVLKHVSRLNAEAGGKLCDAVGPERSQPVL